MSGRFDRIPIDASCSGTGTLAHNPEIKWRLRPGDLVVAAAPGALVVETMRRIPGREAGDGFFAAVNYGRCGVEHPCGPAASSATNAAAQARWRQAAEAAASQGVLGI